MVDIGLTLGAAVAKAACKVWLKDSTIAGDVSATVIDIVRSKVSGRREQRRAARVFEDIEEQVADSILQSMGHEYRGVPENERQAAILAAAGSFDKADLAAPDLFATDLDPLFLARHVKRQSPRATRDLSSGGVELYDQIVAACSEYIVGASTALPGFTVGAFSELLHRQSETLERLAGLAVSLEQSTKRTNAEHFASAYRQLVVSQLDRVQLFGFTISDALRRYPLSTSYITLTVAAKSDSTVDSWRRLYVSELAQQVQSGTAPVNVALAVSRRLLIRGEAGSGKTTLLQWLAVQAAAEKFAGTLRDWKAVTPFFVRLRQYVGKELPAPEQFLDGMGRHISNELPPGWVHERLRSGAALILVDGVDELPEGGRAAAREWLEGLVSTFPKSRYVVTSRPAAAGADWLDELEFASVEVQPMSVADARNLIHFWHSAVQSVSSDNDERERIAESERHLAKAITEHRHLRQIVVNPLLAAMLCALHLDRRMQLPIDRLELYAIAIEALIERRDVERRISGDYESFSRTARMFILQEISYWMLRNGLSTAPIDRVESRIQQVLAGMPRNSRRGVEVLSLLLNRSGLIREPIPGQVDFVHRTFQEYLAARAVVDADDIEVLLQHVDDDQWREVIMMACGQALAPQRDTLLRGVIERAAGKTAGSARIKALAVGCLEISPQLAPDLARAIKSLARALLPPRTLSEAGILANAGEMILELLPDSQVRSVRRAAATVRLASLVGGELGFDIVKRYASTEDDEVATEVEQAWGRFDLEEFARTVLPRQHRWRRLILDDPEKVPFARYTKRFTILCQFARGYGDLAFATDLPDLRHLIVREDRLLVDLAPLAVCDHLDMLYLGQTGSLALDPLEHISNLTHLELDCEEGQIDIAGLRCLLNLKKLQLVNSGMVSRTLQDLPADAELERLGFWRAPDVINLCELLNCPQLAGLDFLLLGNAENLTSIDGVSAWSETCTGLYIHAPRVQDFSELARMPRIDFLNLQRCGIEDMAFASNLPELRILHIGGTVAIPDLAPLRELRKLERLFVYGDDQVDLSPLAGMTNLTVDVGRRSRQGVIGRSLLGKGSSVVTTSSARKGSGPART
jgi:hypothetical protein